MQDIDWLYELPDSEINCLYTISQSPKIIDVKQYDHYRWLEIGGNAIQSLMDTEKPESVLNPVTKIMLSGCYLRPEISSVLNLGMGGGAIERFFWHYYPEIYLHSIESAEEIIHIAREYFNIPTSKPVFNMEAESYLTQTDEKYDLIFCDIFTNQTHPECLYRQAFFQSISTHLNTRGIFLLNLVPEDQDDLLAILLALRPWFHFSYLYELQDHFNIIVIASNQPIDKDSINHQKNNCHQNDLLEKEQFIEQLVALP